jgi:hypothetical protein
MTIGEILRQFNEQKTAPPAPLWSNYQPTEHLILSPNGVAFLEEILKKHIPEPCDASLHALLLEQLRNLQHPK